LIRVGSFVDTSKFNIFGNYAVVNKTYEFEIEEDQEIKISAINGHILVKKYMGEKVKINSQIRAPQNDIEEPLILIISEGVASLTPTNTSNISITHEVFLPAVNIKKIRFESSNGRICIEDISAREVEAVTKNSHIDITGVTCDKIMADTKNGRIQTSHIICKDFCINTSNSIIDMKHMKVENMDVNTVNGKIQLENVHCIDGSTQINMALRTTNAGIKVNMNDMDNKSYRINAHTSNGDINLLIPEITFNNISKQMGKNYIEAESKDYDFQKEKVVITASTTNGYIEIVK
jgi:DUF4097 and DUF4098 domain-containing protein YvlB